MSEYRFVNVPKDLLQPHKGGSTSIYLLTCQFLGWLPENHFVNVPKDLLQPLRMGSNSISPFTCQILGWSPENHFANVPKDLFQRLRLGVVQYIFFCARSWDGRPNI